MFAKSLLSFICLAGTFCYLIQPFKAHAVNQLTDPTKPPDFNAQVSDSGVVDQVITVNAIMKKRERFLAIINNQQIQVGGEIQGWKVQKITAKHVLMKSTEDMNSPSVQFRVSEQINVKQQVNFD